MKLSIFAVEEAGNVRASLRVEDFPHIGSFNISISYDPTKLEPVTIPNAITCNQGTIGHATIRGLIKFGWFTYPAVKIENGEELLAIEFKRIAKGETKIDFITDDGFSDSSFAPIPNIEYIGAVVVEAVKPVLLPVFPAKAKVAEKKKLMGYNNKQPKNPPKSCKSCIVVKKNKCSHGGFVVAMNAICKHHH